jgi:hypothetical protein
MASQVDNIVSNAIDWDEFATRKASFTINSLAQHAAANVDVVTVQIGRLICDQFKIPVRGDRNVSDAFNNLPVYDSHGWAFGFGFDHIARGAWSWVIPGILLEYFDEKFSARVCSQLASDLGTPQEMAPSLYQWERLMHACSGVLATNRFGVLVDQFVRLNPYNHVVTSHVAAGTSAHPRGHTSPEAVAKALHLLAKLSSGKVSQIQLIGTDDIGWLAAVAEWLFDMTVKINSATGKNLYCNCAEKDPQVELVFESDDQEEALQQLQLGDNAYRLQDVVDDERANVREDHYLCPVLGGRVLWESLFSAVFEDAFMTVLHTEVTIIGTTVACAARVLQAITTGEEGVPSDLCASSWLSGPGSYGAGLVQTMTNWFLGFSRALSNMQHCLKLPLAEAISRYEEQLVKLKKLCACSVCEPHSNARKDFCQLAMMESIVALGVSLSRIVIAPELFPKRSGIRLLYEHQCRQVRATQEKGLRGIERIAYVYGDVFKANNSVMLNICAALFSGVAEQFHHTDRNALSLTTNGVCSITGSLYRLTGKPAEKGDIRAVPGTAEYRGRLYDHVIAYESFEEDMQTTLTSLDREDKFEVIVPGKPDEPLRIKPRSTEAVTC